MNTKRTFAVVAFIVAAGSAFPFQEAAAWWGGDRWGDSDRWYYDRPYRYGGYGPYGWGGGPYGWGGGPYGWGGNPWGWGNAWGNPYGGAYGNKSEDKLPPIPE